MIKRRLEEIEVDINKPFEVEQEEFNDEGQSRLYRSYDPPFDKVHEEGLKAYEWLKNKYNWS